MRSSILVQVTEVNKRWQKYNNDRQMYVQRLLSTIQDQQEQMNKIVETRAFPCVQQVTSPSQFDIGITEKMSCSFII
jgi:hypothetical protein